MSDQQPQSDAIMSRPVSAAVISGGRLIGGKMMVPHQGTPLFQCPTNLNLELPAHREMLFAIGNPGDMQIGEQGYIDVKCCYWVIYPDSAIDEESGEVREFCRTVLIQADGRFFKTTAEWAPNRLRDAMLLFTPEEWEQGLTFRITERKSRREKRTYHDIRVVLG